MSTAVIIALLRDTLDAPADYGKKAAPFGSLGQTREVRRNRIHEVDQRESEAYDPRAELAIDEDAGRFLEREGAYNVPQTSCERLRRTMAQPTADVWNSGSRAGGSCLLQNVSRSTSC